MPALALIVYFIRSITRSTLITPYMKIGNTLFKTRALMWPGTSTSLSLMTICLQMMMMGKKINRHREIMNPSITLLHLNVLPLPLLPTPDKRGFSFSSYSSTSYLSLSPTLEKRGFSFPSSSSGFRNMIQTTAILMYTKQKPSIRAQSAL